MISHTIHISKVKTYHEVDAKNEKVNFSISKTEHIFEKRKGAIDDPHRHNYFTVLIIHKANGVHKIDFNSYDLKPQQIYFVAPGQVHQVIEQEPSIGYVITFSQQFLIENTIDISFIDSLNLFNEYGQSPPLQPNDKQFEKIIHYCSEIFNLFNSDINMKSLSIGAYLKLFLIECNNICVINPIETNMDISKNRIIREFKNMVNNDYKKEHSTSYYAALLHITPDHLNRIIKNNIGKTAKEYIQSRIITEAKRLIFFSKLSNKEIGYELGFSEPANFSAFFKRCTGHSPSKFKKENS